jgi:hypothetical protein
MDLQTQRLAIAYGDLRNRTCTHRKWQKATLHFPFGERVKRGSEEELQFQLSFPAQT